MFAAKLSESLAATRSTKTFDLAVSGLRYHDTERNTLCVWCLFLMKEKGQLVGTRRFSSSVQLTTTLMRCMVGPDSSWDGKNTAKRRPSGAKS